MSNINIRKVKDAVTKEEFFPQTCIEAVVDENGDALGIDASPTEDSDKLVKSGGVKAAIDNEATARTDADSALGIRIDGANLGIQAAMEAVNAEQQRAVQAENAKYEKPNSGIPKADLASDVQASLKLAQDVVYDISAHNNNTAYASLAAALGTGGANIPQSLRKGGMSVRFVLSSDNNSTKYVQYRLMKDEFSTTPADWQGVDATPTAGSQNLMESGGVLLNNIDTTSLLPFANMIKFAGWIGNNGTISSVGYHKVVAVNGASTLKIKRGIDNIYIAIVKSYSGYKAGDTIVDFATGETGVRYISSTSEININIPSDANYIMIGEATNMNSPVRTPSELILDNYDVLKGCIKQLYNIIPTEVLQDSSITTSKIADKNVTPNKLSEKYVIEKLGKNLYNPNTNTANKYFTSDGSIATGDGTDKYSITDYIPLTAETDYCFSNSDNTSIAGKSNMYFCFYNSSKQLITPTIVSTNKTFTTPANCAYGRFTIVKPNDSLAQLELGSVRTAYVPYCEIGGYPIVIGESGLAEQAVKPIKTSFMSLGKNLFDYTTMLIQGKYINANGYEMDNDSYYCSDFIPIDSLKGNIVSNYYGAGGAANAFYDEDKNYIANSSFKTNTSAIPQNAKYIRWTFNKPSLPSTDEQKKSIQVEYGIMPTVHEGYGYKLKDEFIPSGKNTNGIIVPNYMYLLSGVNNDIFYEPILRKWNPCRYDIFANTIGANRNYVKAIKRVVTLNNPTATAIDLSLYDAEKEDFIQTKRITFRKGTQGVGDSEIKVGIIGDSYTDGGCFTPALLSHGYVPNLKLVGTRQVTNYATQCTDGRSGWSLKTFFDVQTNVDYFNPFLHPQGSHRYWGNTAFWAGVCGGSPSGYQARYTQYASLCDANGWPVSPLEGDVIYDSTNSSFKEYQSGSWVTVQQSSYNWEFNYSKYLSMWSIETPDILCVMLGVNDFWVNNYPSEANLLIWKERMNTMISSYKLSNPTGKFVILTANTVTHHNVQHYRPLDVHNRMQILREFVINEWDNKEADGIYVVDTAQLVDSENAFVLIEATPFDGFSGTTKEVYANDGQHPRLNYTTLGYSLAAFIQYMR